MTAGNILWLVVLGVFIYMMIKNGGCCGGHDHGGHGEHDMGGNGHKEHGGPGSGYHHQRKLETPDNQTARDPVCGMEVQEGSPASEHLGRTFHFCSEQCRKIFNLNPNRYIPYI
jgi:YHS domain-containing protein